MRISWQKSLLGVYFCQLNCDYFCICSDKYKFVSISEKILFHIKTEIHIQRNEKSNDS